MGTIKDLIDKGHQQATAAVPACLFQKEWQEDRNLIHALTEQLRESIEELEGLHLDKMTAPANSVKPSTSGRVGELETVVKELLVIASTNSKDVITMGVLNRAQQLLKK